jgi:glycerol-3-phosphate acyltransferase PlsY
MAGAMLVLGYLCGSISSAIVICRLLGHADPRTVGSMNPGTTNVLRLYGKAAAIMTLAGDVAKGVVPVVVAHALDAGDTAIALAGLGAFLGHLYPVFFGFVGGKGVATLIGVLLGFNPWFGIAFMGTWVAVAVITRYSSLSALTATALIPFIAAGLEASAAVVTALVVMAAFVYWRHRSNIRNLRAGREDKIGAKRKPVES